jgi:hypothetical protein
VLGKGYINTPQRVLAAYDLLNSKDSFMIFNSRKRSLLFYKVRGILIGTRKTLETLKFVGQSLSSSGRLKT